MGDILNSIFGFVGDTIVSALETFVVWLYQLIVAVLEYLYQLMAILVNFLWGVIQSVGKFLDQLWNSFFKAIFTKIWDAIKAASTWLESKLGPVVKFLQKVRAYYLRWFNTYIAPFLKLIQQVRQYLQILSFLHLGFAQKLDAWLSQLQAKIVQSFATIIGTLNTAVDILNAIMDPAYLLRKPTLLLSLRRQIPALIHVLTGKPPGYWFPSPKGASGGPFAPLSFPLNFSDTSQNPPASALLGSDDGIGDVDSFLTGFEFSDGAVDQVSPLDYFNDKLYPDPACTDPAKCLNTSMLAVLGANLNG